MKRICTLLVSLGLFASPLYAQTPCSTPGLTLRTEPEFASPGEPILVVLENSGLALPMFTNTCIVSAVYSGTSCSGTPVWVPQFCGGVTLVVPPGGSLAGGWSQRDTLGQQVPNGVYTIEVTYSIGLTIIQCCTQVTITDTLDRCSGDGGDQMGCTPCPCGNEAAGGTIGGCLNSAGSSARLVAGGSTSLANDDLQFEANGLPSSSLSLLFSGRGLAPLSAASPCFGLGSGLLNPNHDGLRCVVLERQRHGARTADAQGDIGVSSPPWGSPNPLPNSDAFVLGTTQFFQGLYRDIALSPCGRSLNTTQAISVMFQP